MANHKKGNVREIIPAVIIRPSESGEYGQGQQKQLDEAINKVKDYVKIIQLDIMDGIFVPERSIDFDFTLPESRCRYEAHLMVADPESWIREYSGRVDTILVHIESCRGKTQQQIEDMIEYVKGQDKKMGFVVNPETPVDEIKPYLGSIDQVLIMTVNPGKYGAKFLPEPLAKARQLRDMGFKGDIEADGGISDITAKQVADAGVNYLVSGSYIMKADEPKKAVALLKGLIALT